MSLSANNKTAAAIAAALLLAVYVLGREPGSVLRYRMPIAKPIENHRCSLTPVRSPAGLNKNLFQRSNNVLRCLSLSESSRLMCFQPMHFHPQPSTVIRITPQPGKVIDKGNQLS